VGAYEVLRQWNYPELENFGSLRSYNWEDAGK
jgi:tRNA (cytidine/uridine-2'-O-)-methyltransferase